MALNGSSKVECSHALHSSLRWYSVSTTKVQKLFMSICTVLTRLPAPFKVYTVMVCVGEITSPSIEGRVCASS